MLSTTPERPLNYCSEKYHTLEGKMAAIWSKNHFPGRHSEGCRELVAYPDNYDVLCWINREDVSYEPHWHSAVEIIMPLSHDYLARINGTEYHMEEGDILLIPPGELHALTPLGSGYRLILMFDYTAISQIPRFSTLSSLLTHPLYITRDNAPNLYENCRDFLLSILNLYVDDEPYWDLSISALFLRLMVLLNRYHQDTCTHLAGLSSSRQKEYLRKFNTVFEFIDQHYMEKLDLETIARSSGFSKFHFCRIFKQMTNVSFIEYLNNRRIQATTALLFTSELPITEIALMSGFSSIATFNRVFRNIKKCTPTEFKKLSVKRNSSLDER